MELRPQLVQQQKLVMTVQMRQAMKILQLNQQEIRQALEDEFLENPSLELNEEEQFYTEGEMELLAAQKSKDEERAEEMNQADFDDQIWEKLLKTVSDSEGVRDVEKHHQMRGGYIYRDLPSVEANHSASPTLIDELLEQLRLEYCTDEERRAAEFIIGNLDHRGYLDCSYEEICEHVQVDMDDIEGAILILREYEPKGCCGRNLQETLLFQAELNYPEDPFFPELIQKHFKLFERRNYKKIGLLMDMDPEDVEEYHKMLRTFNPEPGAAYQEVIAQTLVPDVRVLKVGDEWQVVMGDDSSTHIQISNTSRQMLRELQKLNVSLENGEIEDIEYKKKMEVKKFLEKKLGSAKFLLQSLNHRERTIVRVTDSIVMRQIFFFEEGFSELRPMVLRDVADDLQVAESTVSRIVNHKYVETPQGIFELKFFFSSGIPCRRRGEVSSTVVKRRIKHLIEAENPQKPLSDNALMLLLEKEGFEIARRTVSKYREMQGILSTRQRKRAEL